MLLFGGISKGSVAIFFSSYYSIYRFILLFRKNVPNHSKSSFVGSLRISLPSVHLRGTSDIPADKFSNTRINKSSNSVIKCIQEMSFTTVQFLLKRLTRFFFYSFSLCSFTERFPIKSSPILQVGNLSIAI